MERIWCKVQYFQQNIYFVRPVKQKQEKKKVEVFLFLLMKMYKLEVFQQHEWLCVFSSKSYSSAAFYRRSCILQYS